MPGAQQTIGPPPSHLLETEVNGEICLYDPDTSAVLVLNQTASDVWRLSDGEHTLEEIVRLLASAYSTSPETIRGDVERTLQEIIDQGFLSG